MNDSGLNLNAIKIAIGGRVLINDVTLAIAPGQVVTLMGPSGSGKSSLISFICGSLDSNFAVSGHIALNGADMLGLPIEKRRIGVLFQDDLLFPHMSVGENLAFAIPAYVRGPERKRRALAALEEAELHGYERRSPATLSGGQKARVALMRALLAEPQAMLLDEPFSRLDAALRERIRAFTFNTLTRRNIPALLVTHDVLDASEHVVHL